MHHYTDEMTTQISILVGFQSAVDDRNTVIQEMAGDDCM